MASSAYENVRAAIADEGSDARVEVNQRALIDKILARYASAGAVYRELIQNSNDAEATTAEIIITTSLSKDGNDAATSSSNKEVVTQVIYRNNGLPFRPQDWDRLRKIAEGNPDETKVGAFGVGAYTMFSICEEPLVVSGKKGEEEAMAFFWKGDGLWTKTGKAPEGIVNMSASLSDKSDDSNHWTSFILPSRDPYPLPDLVEFGQFLTASLTFTQCLKNVRVYVNQTLQLNIEKTVLESHTIVTPKARSWWKNDGAVTSSSSGMFTFGKGSDLTQTSVQMNVSLRKGLSPESDMEMSTVRARYASAQVKTNIPLNIEKRMVRVTKKKPPKELMVQIFLDAANDTKDEDGNDKSKLTSKMKKLKSNKQSRAALITDSFSPTPGSGRIFIGFRTSQTTGLGIHLSAPLLPTVEREAIDFVDAALREYNSELLEISGMLMRLALEHEMGRIGILWEEGKDERDRWETQREERNEKEQSKQKEETDESSQTTKDAASTSKETSTISSSLFSFATFMARGVKNTVAEVIKPVQEILGDDDETTELLNPTDDRPLCMEERDAILLMRAYCPRPSTPDSLVGQCLAKGFSRCLPSSSPPVLTMGGVMRGSEAKLPNHGMEAYGFSNVVRRIMLENAREYHSLMAAVPILNIDDLIFSLKNQVLEEKMLIRLLKWWPKVCRVDRSMERRGLRLKEAIRFESSIEEPVPNSDKGAKSSSAETDEDDIQLAHVHSLESILYYTPKKFLDLPLPEFAFPALLQKEIGLRTLENNIYQEWFSSLPFDIWTSFISQHPCLTTGLPEDLNALALTALSKHHDSLEGTVARRRFVELLPTNSPCIPFDSEDDKATSSKHHTAIPKELYLATSDLSAFAGIGVFHKASKRLLKNGVSDTFLLSMGVRTTISIDFLFLHLDTLRWNTNPKPLIKYLLDSDLSHPDLLKLRSTQYLPAENDETHVYAPSELYLKNSDLKIFPFVRFLQWPASEGMSKAKRDFLIKLGVRVDPPLASVMNFMEEECKNSDGVRDDKVYEAALQYLTKHLGPNGLFLKDFSRFRSTKFLPCIRQNLETGDVIKEMQSPAACYYNPSALIMGFSTLDPQLDTVHIATRTQCSKDPSCRVLIARLIQLVDISKAKVEHFQKNGGNDDGARQALREKLLTLFDVIFLYLATRTSDFDKRDLTALVEKAFIPCTSRGQVVFYAPSQIFFKKEALSTETTSNDDGDSLTDTLFQQIKYNAFLSLVGVKAEPSLAEIFGLMIEKPDEVLDQLGEEKYKAVLRRIASNPPFKQITKEIRSCAFLLGYLVLDEEVAIGDEVKDRGQKAQYLLGRAEDIHIVDNSFLRRQFPLVVAPMEQSLEEFYNKIGSKYVSQVVKKDFEVQGRTYQDTALTKSFANRLRERRPLLLSPTNSSRPLSSNAAKILDDQYLEVIQAEKIQAKYSFEGSSKHLKVTCCTKQKTRQKTTIYLTTNPDWFDIGSAIGALILQRCQLEDALLLSQLLESPLETLRYRGFPVDRILRPVSKPQPPPLPLQPAEIKSTARHPEASGSIAKGKSPESNPESNSTSHPGNKGEDGFEQILKQMFPSCPSDAIRGLLGPNPTKEKVREVANLLAAEMPPSGDESKKQDGTKSEANDSNPLPSQKSLEDGSINGLNDHKANIKEEKATKKKSSGLLGKMRSKFHHGVGSGGHQITHDNTQQFSQAADSNTPSSPERDASSQNSLEAMLNQAVQSSRSVDNAGVRSAETLLNHMPQGLERGSDGCEVIDAQNIQPFRGPHGNFKSKNGIKVFSGASAGPAFLSQNFNAVERFAVVIQHLATVYKLNLATVAIYYEPNGNTIAFNCNKALYFNLRFFCALHQNHVGSTCYSYWYMVFAHELAHNLVTAHNKEHGSFTESIAALYLPEFGKLLSQIP
mmetsp:Transcript_6127/g.13879  ORF Transcript_6127/g.13879 Transcript_6127/m.13879 type:complete len:1897 (+) Transcript_6127:127-5817(+)|eukprot:CAMPEP_0172312616 /NCGR_PEP_ID=MMETSP1058-20130122/18144_1 /TAXON_ID=83371 /ORGANISM="Detonula confervacea, Strain CCMP 353" /LENGTH=1896 /DNA_ID=CAMNT_0013026133 /DNA_START=64 /DNA_END=5757 /DNA_ORIENTATION=-